MENGNIINQEHDNQFCNEPFVIWLTGLSGSGKSTLANLLQNEFLLQGIHSYILDGDLLRSGLNNDLDFSIEGRRESVRRTVEVCKLMMDAGITVISSLISPIENERERARELLGENRFFLVYINCPIEVCEKRDPKNLYKKFREGKIQNFTGIDSPYEIPQKPNLIINTDVESPSDSIKKLLNVIFKNRAFQIQQY